MKKYLKKITAILVTIVMCISVETVYASTPTEDVPEYLYEYDITIDGNEIRAEGDTVLGSIVIDAPDKTNGSTSINGVFDCSGKATMFGAILVPKKSGQTGTATVIFTPSSNSSSDLSNAHYGYLGSSGHGLMPVDGKYHAGHFDSGSSQDYLTARKWRVTVKSSVPLFYASIVVGR